MNNGRNLEQINFLTTLGGIFHTYNDPYRAHEEARELLVDLSPWFFKPVLQQHLSDFNTFNCQRKNPVLEFIIESNEHYTLIANCFLPRDDGNTHLSHQSVHHHGSLLLSTASVFGPGYETWNFTKPQSVPGRKYLYNMSVISAVHHQVGNALFVDAYFPHIVFYPPQLSVTLALWSNRTPVNWKTRIKRNILLQRLKMPLKDTAKILGLAHFFELNVVSFFDYYPSEGAFKGLKKRAMYPLGSNEKCLRNMFYIIQETCNDDFVDLVDHMIKRNGMYMKNRQLVEDYNSLMKEKVPIHPAFENSQHFLALANLRQVDVRGALSS